jgi:uncharacterized protein YwqG
MTYIFLIILAIFGIFIFIVISRMTEKIFSPKSVTDSHPTAKLPVKDAPISEETKQAISTVKAQLSEAALPFSEFIVGEEPPKTANESRLGGPVYLPKGAQWPLDQTGGKLLFLAQINFAQMPMLKDFPKTGILQIFIANNDLFGADFDTPEKGVLTILYHEALEANAECHDNLPYPALRSDYSSEAYSPFLSEAVQTQGRAVRFDPAVKQMTPDLTHWKYDSIADGIEDEEAVEALWDELALERPAHYVGGHISLTQSDFRYNAPYSEYDRILLQLGWDDNIMWGDAGEMSLSMRKDDIVNRRFEKAIFWWDCC